MLCSDVMKAPVVRCYEHETASECARRMSEFGVGILPVVDRLEALVGVVTDRDLALRVLGTETAGHTPVRDVMTRDVHVCRAEESLQSVEERLAACRKSRLIVVDAKHHCVGVISVSDIARTDGGSRTGRVLSAVARRGVDRPRVLRGH
jgi:CBS domain-containing protein